MGQIFMRLQSRSALTSTINCCARVHASRENAARILLHRAARERRVFTHSPLGRLAELQRLHHGDKAAKEYTDSMGRRKVKGNMDIELAVDAMELAPHVDHIVIFSGDGDFRPLVEACNAKVFAFRSFPRSAASHR